MSITVKDTATAKLAAIGRRVADLTPLMTMMGRHMENSVRRNFNVGGRPKWDDLKGVIVLPKGASRSKKVRVQGRTRMGGPLVLTGDLRDHIGFTPQEQDLIVWARPEHDPVKAFVHQYGTTRAGRGHNVTIPARPYLIFQDEDLSWFKKACAGWIRVGGAMPL
jgi:phage virion morphogenesis protein